MSTMQEVALMDENRRLRASHDRLLVAAKRVIEICDDPGSASADVPWSLSLLKAAIAKGDELEP
jgi:hypothetical protein